MAGTSPCRFGLRFAIDRNKLATAGAITELLLAGRHTLVHRIADWAERQPNAPAIYGRVGDRWKQLTWRLYWSSVRQAAKGLIKLGLQPGDCVAIVGDNRPSWVVAQFGIMSARGIPAPIYATNTDDQTAYIVGHCKARIAICDTAEQLAKYQRCLESGAMDVDHIITMDDVPSDDERVMSMDNLMEIGAKEDDTQIDARLQAMTDTETALLIYTSGTTGVPKAVKLTNAGMIAVADSTLECFPIIREPGNFRMVSYLPLCHVAEQMFTNMFHLATGGEVYFCPDLKQIKEFLVHVRPTIFLGVPRVWEKFQAALQAKLSASGPPKKWLTDWAMAAELRSFRASAEHGVRVDGLGRSLANKLVIDKVKEAIGMDKLLVAATGAAPISVSTLEFFASMGITIYEGFGMSETSGVATCGEQGKPRFGTVGRALSCCEVQIAPDGEILLKGINMTSGYLHMPEQTAELLDDEGWLHTGDLGSLDGDGFLKITGRKKDLIITAGGKNVAPAELESYLKQIDGVGQAVVVGDRQPYLCALLTLDPDGIDALCEAVGIDNSGLESVSVNVDVREFIEARVEEFCNSRVAQYQTIKKFEILPMEFTVETDELTPTMKLKRNVVNVKYAAQIEAFYKP